MHALIASPFLDTHLVLRPDDRQALKIGARHYRELLGAAADAPCPQWLTDAARRRWALSLDGQLLANTVKVRQQSPYGYGRASYELNLGCNYGCVH